MQMKYRTLYHMKTTTEINTLQCLLENQVHKIASYEKHKKINTLQCLHENEEQKDLSHEKHNRN